MDAVTPYSLSYGRSGLQQSLRRSLSSGGAALRIIPVVNHKRGRSVCANHLEAPTDGANVSVLKALRRCILNPRVVERALGLGVADIESSGAIEERCRRALARDFAQVEVELLFHGTFAAA